MKNLFVKYKDFIFEKETSYEKILYYTLMNLSFVYFSVTFFKEIGKTRGGGQGEGGG